jgi:hypothetical protein
MKETALLLAAVIVCVVFLWPQEGWRNEWSSDGECLAWRVQSYGLFERDLRGPYLVADRWC